jgi:hypothetical protein
MLQSTHGFLVEKLGYYLRLKAEMPAEIWVHYGPPTLLNQPWPTHLLGVRIRMRTFGDAALSQVHLWDGGRRIARHDSVNARLEEGEAQRNDDSENSGFGELYLELESTSSISSAIGVSLLVAAQSARGGVAISGIGIDLRTTTSSQ